jgi:hypothetical protein
MQLDFLKSDDHELRTVAAIKAFILSGNAKITVQSQKSKKHFTYKIRKDKDAAVWYVHRLTTSNSYYQYLGTIFDGLVFRPTRKTSPSVMMTDHFIAFNWLWEQIEVKNRMPPNTKVFHEGRCGMCGIELTDPVSIKAGYGPECRKKLAKEKVGKDNPTDLPSVPPARDA